MRALAITLPKSSASSLHPSLPALSKPTKNLPETCSWNIRRRRNVEAKAAPMTFEEGQSERPAWTGDTLTSRAVAAIISFKPLYSLLKFAARRVLISTAQKNGIEWDEMAQEILASQDVYKLKNVLENASVDYPDYYLNAFHAYDEGNLCWQAAAEVEAATLCLAKRSLPSILTAEEATKILRGNWVKAIQDHHSQFSGGLQIHDILDVGCSAGVSTRFLADEFPNANVTGLDLSAYYLAVAEYRERQRSKPRQKPIKWLHAKGEDTGLLSASFDIVSFSYVIHECPQYATKNLLAEAYRLLRPGGTVALTDNSPKSKIVQNLPPALFTLMKSTEPFLDEYYTLDLEKTMEDVGFTNVRSILTDPRHRTVTGSVPNL